MLRGRRKRRGEIVIDRPRGSLHPKYGGAGSPLDYGHVEGTSGGDGDRLDLWRGSARDASLVGIVCTVDRVKRDAEIKLLLGCTSDEIEAVRRFHNNGDGMSALVVRRDTTER